MINLQALGWLLVILAPLLLFQRYLHRELQAVLLILTRRADLTIMLFSLIFLPGVVLHEASHWLMAKILRVPTGRFSILPRPMGNGRLQMGFVDTASADWFRDALIGAAPLISGGLVVAYAGLSRLSMDDTWLQASAGTVDSLTAALSTLYSQPDFWLWMYLIFVVSSMMFPSASDRQAWLPVLLVLLALAILIFLAGAGSWFMAHLEPALNIFLRIVTIIFAISAFVHMILLPPIWGIRLVLTRLTGYKVV